MNAFEFKVAVREKVEASVPRTFDGKVFRKGGRSAHLRCDDQTAHLQLYLASSIFMDGNNLRLRPEHGESFDVAPENVDAVASLIIRYLNS